MKKLFFMPLLLLHIFLCPMLFLLSSFYVPKAKQKTDILHDLVVSLATTLTRANTVSFSLQARREAETVLPGLHWAEDHP